MPSEYRFHRRVALDIFEAESFFIEESGQELADRFTKELFDCFREAAEEPMKAHFDLTARCRRVNLKAFPYHFLYDRYGDFIFIFVVRHDKRHPLYGLRRKR